MSKVLFVSVGTSALTARELRAPDERQSAALRERAANFAGHDLKTKGELAGSLLKELIEAHSLHHPGPDYVKHPYRTSAEMTSTWLLFGDEADLPGRFDHAAGDRIVLLASATEEGKLAASINVALMRRLFFQCDCVPETCNAVKLEVVEGLEARQKKDGPMKTLENIQSIMRRHNSQHRYFNITGGYKGAIPAIAHLCATEFNPCPMFYQHESARTSLINRLGENASAVGGEKRHDGVLWSTLQLTDAWTLGSDRRTVG
ncbi:MAG: hypothetical protein LAO20_22890, partial [Acidobacteriia bacterium]|nr:hypothetical protein [Terriglobia bacterium]